MNSKSGNNRRRSSGGSNNNSKRSSKGTSRNTSKSNRGSNSSKSRTKRNNSGTRRNNSRGHHKNRGTSSQRNQSAIPPAGDNIRIIPLGGVEEVGKNMTAIEFRDEIIVVDCGFQFKDEETPGIDFILPNITYLEERKQMIKGLFITHGHLDHIGGIPYLIDKLGYPPIYSRKFGAIMIKKRQAEFPDLKQLNIQVVEGDERVRLSENWSVKTFGISHAIPDSMGLIIETPHGKIVLMKDVRVDHVGGEVTQEEKDRYKNLPKDDVLLFTLDSTSIEKPGFSTPESKVVETIDEIMKKVSGRLIIATFASQVDRIISIMKMAEKYNKMIVVEGRSMRSNVDIIKELNMMKPENIISVNQMDDFPKDRIVILATGAQGEEYAALMRISNKTHRDIRLRNDDTVLLSSSVIPGNEYSITKLKDNLYRSGAKIITYYDADVHASGHGNRGELEWIHKQVNYKFFMPVHGHHYMLRIHEELAESLGTPKGNVIVPDNGSIVEIQDGGKKFVKTKFEAPSDIVMVDGFHIGDMQDVVIRDRQLLAEDGIFIIVVALNPRSGKLRKSPDIISRGFVYLRESQELLSESRDIIKKVVDSNSKQRPINFDQLKSEITDHVRKFLLQETDKRPLVIPVIIGV